jgi:TM2 domain-containing membrane protein YozV
MSDENIHDGNKGWAQEPVQEPAAATTADAPKAFCQDCGKPLTPDTLRTVGAGVFCEPCLAARVGVPVATAAIPIPGEPHPVLAAFLGIIPGVGAMYNGQYAKGFAHLFIFLLLGSLKDHVSDVFGFLCFVWWCYMIFDAYHTAKARLEGLPLPNPFGLNDIGERMGFVKTGTTAGAGTVPPYVPPTPYTPPTYAPPPPYNAPPTAGPDWIGYVPPTEFGAAAAYKPTPTVPLTASQTGYGAPTYTGAPATEHAVPYVAPVVPPVPTRRFPVGAFWLIGLGALILLATVMPEEWSINGRWFPPVIFTALAVLILQRRLRYGRRLICYLRWPVIFLILAVMTGLHAAYFAVTFGLTCAVVLIALGALLLLERTVGAAPMYVPPAPVDDATRASFTSAGPATPSEPVATDETEKGGQ